MALSDQLSRLSVRARAAEERVATARAEVRERLEDDDAEAAADYAQFAIDFAYTAIEEAEYAVLDAVLAGRRPPAGADAVG